VSSHVARALVFSLNLVKTKYKLSTSPGYAVTFSNPLGAEGIETEEMDLAS